jgi:hypothetical protein
MTIILGAKLIQINETEVWQNAPQIRKTRRASALSSILYLRFSTA